MSISPILQAKNISLLTKIHQNHLLDNISFDVNEGEKIALIGGNGAGKSTLLKVLNHLCTSSKGDLYFRGKLVHHWDVLKFRRQVMLIPQESKLLGMNVKSALSYPLQLQSLSEKEIQTRLIYCLQEFNFIESWLEKRENELSLGQKQLVAIARAIIMQPSVLLLDEPTSALDKGNAHWLREKLQVWNEEKKMTIIVINHDLEWVKNFAQRVIWLDKGRIKKDLSAKLVDWEMIEKHLLTLNQEMNIDEDF
ncbi:ABC transporter ATP-binding protein [Cyanobacterium aponinum UTEX 3222]|uniref:ATP-binding cassette domain-containing protein n=2 Tax=Cyanobacterium aponinum TaxID=379064 RepID=A0A844GR94_9CHRO|nr:ABC transporter ATP-binding protein [Cyanobacterium aponinum]WRL41595.1 ABC transporter ATP-binding protein [Cyanobacterium aponinum UTEX 3222]MBD2395879.1 ABC transporter ATP-binding protein [Cyanobacterium aponinum FACHB-4101]MTF38460.1 ATP-binding cassette domain-containing protein [Cyanobacterium aponinum 0216]PHV63496.1 cobalt ABC transporter [Cyanobacterium aponinum IPPAS B-1201]WPF89787.1 ABC transporter ATP-binding protein [Cyanobacterium aponinum AL20115]